MSGVESGAASRWLTIGFAGHRDLGRFGDPGMVAERLGTRLDAVIATLAAQGRPLRLVTGLADGADRVMIERCRRQMPVRGIASGDACETAIARSLAEVEAVAAGLTGTARYVAVADRILAACDVLVAVVDPAAGTAPGGTRDTVRRARGIGRLVIPVSPWPDPLS